MVRIDRKPLNPNPGVIAEQQAFLSVPFLFLTTEVEGKKRKCDAHTRASAADVINR